MIEALGLTPGEAAAYRLLVDHAPLDASGLAALLGAVATGAEAPGAGTAPEQAGDLLAALERAGLATRHGPRESQFVAAPPAMALAPRVLEHEEALGRARLELDRLTARYRLTASGRLLADVVDVVEGPSAVAQRFAQIQRNATSEVLVFVLPAFAAVPPEENPDEDDALGRGVGYRVVLQREGLGRPGAFADITDTVPRGMQVRVAREVPLRMIIADRSVAMLPLASALSGQEGALLVHPSGLLDALVVLFEAVWSQASSVALADDGVGVVDSGADALEPIDAHLLALLLAGLTDRAIGTQLGLSHRTVQRRVRALMDRCEVDTRLQLGYEAGRRGWLSRTRRPEQPASQPLGGQPTT